jgi:hypothetical protein
MVPRPVGIQAQPEVESKVGAVVLQAGGRSAPSAYEMSTSTTPRVGLLGLVDGRFTGLDGRDSETARRARLAFPDGGVTGKTLRRRAREGKLAVYRPGKAYLVTLSGARVMIEKTRVIPARERPPRPTPIVPNSLGLTESDLANMRLDRVLENLRRSEKEAKRLRGEERARAAPAHRLEMQERRRAASTCQVSTKEG